MRTGESTPAQTGIMDQGVLLHELANCPETPILQLANVEMSGRRVVFRPSEKNVARRLHGTLTFDDPPARMTAEFRRKAFKNGFARLFNLKE